MHFIERHAPDLKAALAGKYPGADFCFDRFAEDFCVFGSPSTVAGRLRELNSRLGASYVLCSLNFITLDHDLCLRSMNLFANEVMPQLRQTQEATA
jgi:hypothetical protein